MLSNKDSSEMNIEVEILEEMQQFLHSAVHDLRAAQRRTRIAAELLLEASEEKERVELKNQALQGISKTEELLNGISKFANALAPHRYSMKPFPFASAVRFALANLDRQIRETGATVTIGDLPEVEGDRDRIAELMEHLIGNSLKFRGSEAPIIEIRAQKAAGGWVFSVKDNGQGIAPKYRDRLFVPFRRLQGADVPGAGLGLATARKIAEAHRGLIGIDEGDSTGVSISFFLPTADGDQRA